MLKKVLESCREFGVIGKILGVLKKLLTESYKQAQKKYLK